MAPIVGLVSDLILPSLSVSTRDGGILGGRSREDFYTVDKEENPDPEQYYPGPDGFGNPDMGSRVFQWGWNPVGGGSNWPQTPNDLVSGVVLGTVTVTTT